MKTKIYKSYADFKNRENKEENGVSENFARMIPNFEEDNSTNKGCWDCLRCSYCNDCNGCYECNGCKACNYCNYCNYWNDCRRCNATSVAI